MKSDLLLTAQGHRPGGIRVARTLGTRLVEPPPGRCPCAGRLWSHAPARAAYSDGSLPASAPAGKPGLVRRRVGNYGAVGVEAGDVAELQLPDAGFNDFAVAYDDPKQPVRFDDGLGGFGDFAGGEVPDAFGVGVPVVVGEIVGDEFGDVARYCRGRFPASGK